jgi:hypothetical protein
MNAPTGIDHLLVTEVGLNSCYFPPEVMDQQVEEKIAALFPNADLQWRTHSEDPSIGVLYIVPEPPHPELLFSLIEEVLPQGLATGEGLEFNDD